MARPARKVSLVQVGQMATLALLACLATFPPFLSGEPLSFKPPKLSEEEQDSPSVPKGMMCDACIAASWHIFSALSRSHDLAPASAADFPLYESVVFDTLENACYKPGFDDYGIKAVDGHNRLSGAGLKAKDSAGMIIGGGKWPGRLQQLCLQIIGDYGEEEVYNKYWKNRQTAEGNMALSWETFALAICAPGESEDGESEGEDFCGTVSNVQSIAKQLNREPLDDIDGSKVKGGAGGKKKRKKRGKKRKEKKRGKRRKKKTKGNAQKSKQTRKQRGRKINRDEL